MLVLKWMDLAADDGGIELPVNLPHALQPFDPVLERLTVQGHVDIDRKKARWVLTDQGVDYLGALIDEAEGYIEEFDEVPADEIVAMLRERGVDPLRVRFLWGWYQGEFDDPVLYQERRGLFPIEPDWASFVLGDAFFADLAAQLGGNEPSAGSVSRARGRILRG